MSSPDHIFVHMLALGEDAHTIALIKAKEYVVIHTDAWVIDVVRQSIATDLEFFKYLDHYTAVQGATYAIVDHTGQMKVLVLTSQDDATKAKSSFGT